MDLISQGKHVQAVLINSNLQVSQIWQTFASWYHPRRQGPPVMARSGVLPLYGNAHLHQGEETTTSVGDCL